MVVVGATVVVVVGTVGSWSVLRMPDGTDGSVVVVVVVAVGVGLALAAEPGCSRATVIPIKVATPPARTTEVAVSRRIRLRALARTPDIGPGSLRTGITGP